MLAAAVALPTPFSTIAGACWPLQDHTITQDQQHNNHVYTQNNYEASDQSSLVHWLPFQQNGELHGSMPSTTSISSNPAKVQKLYHNARERSRRKKMGRLYSALRSLLPKANPMKTLSVPATISGVVKYIPELQQQVEGLIQKKEELLSRISREKGEKTDYQENDPPRSSSSVVSANWLNDREVMVQISTYKNPLPETLLSLEEDGFLLLNASSSESFGGRLFYNLHLQLQSIDKLELEVLSEKLLPFSGRPGGT